MTSGLWELKTTVSMIFFEHPKHMLRLMDKKTMTSLRSQLSLIMLKPYVLDSMHFRCYKCRKCNNDDRGISDDRGINP